MTEQAPEPTKQRPGDQVLPNGRPEREPVQDRIIREMEESKQVGLSRYGQYLRPFNGRRSIQDVREEARDLLVYLTQIEMEIEATRGDLIEEVTAALREIPGVEEGAIPIVAEIAVDRILGHTAGAIAMNSRPGPVRPDPRGRA